jgi:hypothetical protein
MLRNIHSVIVRVVRRIFMNISMSLPKEYYLGCVATRLGTVLSSVRDNSMRLNRECLSAMKAYLINTCRIRLAHASPRTPLLMLLAGNELFVTYWTDLLIRTRHIFLSVEKHILNKVMIPQLSTGSSLIWLK